VTATNEVLLPRGSLLLHIGPHKTGTTSVQRAFHLACGALRAQGVHYTGPDRHAVTAAQAAIETTPRDGRRVRPIDPWRRLLRQVRAANDRVVVSSEWFADADPRGPAPRAAAPRARIETSEVSRVPTGTPLLVIAGRLVRPAAGRSWPPVILRR
jgi:hypothetical protein